ncbi:hypothetical protein EO95_10480 [Methanosarcina sp. 1.H.T.1A.1]|nr:hypothetical protein EO93_11135 [Methanosarcina sp. 1.H.A.2.2]KKH96451.1 hypothetical protein EO95_10480 [Methanosarcina sp. 1.H.T.1A.1]
MNKIYRWKVLSLEFFKKPDVISDLTGLIFTTVKNNSLHAIGFSRIHMSSNIKILIIDCGSVQKAYVLKVIHIVGGYVLNRQRLMNQNSSIYIIRFETKFMYSELI